MPRPPPRGAFHSSSNGTCDIFLVLMARDTRDGEGRSAAARENKATRETEAEERVKKEQNVGAREFVQDVKKRKEEKKRGEKRGYLGCEVFWGAAEGLHGGGVRDALLAQAKVCDLHMSVFVQHQILQLEGANQRGSGLERRPGHPSGVTKREAEEGTERFGAPGPTGPALYPTL